MVKRMFILLAAILVLLHIPAAAAEDGEELLSGGGFESSSDANIWKPYHSYDVAYRELVSDRNFVYEGNQSVKFVNVNGQSGRGIFYSQNGGNVFSQAKTGDIFEFSGYFKTDAPQGTNLSVCIGYNRFGKERYEPYDDVLLNGEWQKVTQRYIYLDDESTGFLRINTDLTTAASDGSQAEAYVYADSLSLKKTGSLASGDLARLLYRRYFMSKYEYYTAETANAFKSSQQADGTWSDINYTDSLSNRTSTALTHLNRVLAMAVNLNRVQHKEELAEAIEKGIAAWNEKIPVPLREDGSLKHGTSWWYDTIGQQYGCIGPIISLTDGMLSEKTKMTLLSYMYDFSDMSKNPTLLTGANLTWYCHNGIIKGLYSGKESDALICYERMMDEWKTARYSWSEGVQSDYSFHQHLQQFQPTYAGNFIKDSALDSFILKSAGYNIETKCENIIKLILNGYSWCFRGKYMWPMLCGREISEKAYVSGDTSEVASAAVRFSKLSPENADGLIKFSEYLNNNETSDALILGNKYFNCSDFMVHNRKAWSAAVRMISNRTVASESSSTQNFWGQYSGAGECAMSKDGDIQNDAFLFYDRTELPGTTLPKDIEKSKWAGTFVHQIDGFAGGVSDGEYGAAAMELSRWNVKAKKAWFFFDNEYVSLGADILSTRNSVTTAVDTRLLKGTVKADGTVAQGEAVYTGVKNIFANNIGYYFPNGQNVFIKSGEYEKSWGNLNNSGDTEAVKRNVFSVTIPHGSRPRGEGYAYIVVPEITESEFSDYTKNCPVRIISNTGSLQAVSHSSGVHYAVFYEPGNCTFDSGIKITADKPCMVLVREADADSCSISVSCADKDIDCVNITLKKGDNQNILTLQLPKNSDYSEMHGSTVTQTLSLCSLSND